MVARPYQQSCQFTQRIQVHARNIAVAPSPTACAGLFQGAGTRRTRRTRTRITEHEMKKVFTLVDIRELNICIDPVEAGYCDERWSGTALDILNADHVPANERLWLVMRPGWLPWRVSARFSAWCYEEAEKAEITTLNGVTVRDGAWDVAWADSSAAAWSAKPIYRRVLNVLKSIARCALLDDEPEWSRILAERSTCRAATWHLAPEFARGVENAVRIATAEKQIRKLIELLNGTRT